MIGEEGAAAFGPLLRERRRAAGLTQAELAACAGLSERGIQNLERGVRRPYRPPSSVWLPPYACRGRRRPACRRRCRPTRRPPELPPAL